MSASVPNCDSCRTGVEHEAHGCVDQLIRRIVEEEQRSERASVVTYLLLTRTYLLATDIPNNIQQATAVFQKSGAPQDNVVACLLWGAINYFKGDIPKAFRQYIDLLTAHGPIKQLWWNIASCIEISSHQNVDLAMHAYAKSGAMDESPIKLAYVRITKLEDVKKRAAAAVASVNDVRTVLPAFMQASPSTFTPAAGPSIDPAQVMQRYFDKMSSAGVFLPSMQAIINNQPASFDAAPICRKAPLGKRGVMPITDGDRAVITA